MKKLSIGCVILSMVITGACSTGGGGSKGDKRFAQAEYELAIQEYKSALGKGKEPGLNNYKIAESYRLSNRLQESESFYKAAIDNKVQKEEAAFYYGMALKANGKYNEAASQFNNYASTGTNQQLVARARMENQNMQQLGQIRGRKMYKVDLIEGINSPSADYAPVMLNNEVVFTSGRNGKTYQGNGVGFHDLFAIKFDNPTSMSGGSARAFSDVVNKGDTHDAIATFTPDDKTMVFARSNDGSNDGGKDVDLYMSRLQGSTWSAPTVLSVNMKDAWDSTPMFSPDGQTLYFSSNRPGGIGGNDIYKTTMDKSGRFSNPVNMGPSVNTLGNESFPYVAQDGTFYFASDGHPGLGNLDLFRLEGDKAVNMGTDINSNADDFGMLAVTREIGLFSSNRAGGKGNDDIYRYELIAPKNVTYYAEVTVVDAANNAKLGTSRVALLGPNDNKLQEQTTDASAMARFKLDSATAYTVMAEKEGYFAKRVPVSTVGKRPKDSELRGQENDVNLPVTIALEKIVVNRPIVLKNIFYDFDKADIRPDAAIVLDTLANTLKDTPGITIELSSHTDVRGDDAYNLDLSQRRAQAAVDYLISKGVNKDRITAKGYGETQLVVKNARTPAQHQLNRRTEFKVTKLDGQTIESPTPGTTGGGTGKKRK